MVPRAPFVVDLEEHGALHASVVERLLTNKVDAAAMGRRAQEVVRTHQGATQRHVDLILEQLNGRAS